jgi:hypothetical protein
MALSDLVVFEEYAYSSMSEMLDYNVDLFNQATRGGMVLRTVAHQGDFSEQAMWAKLSGLVRRRDAYGSGSLSEKTLQHITETSVKVAAGINPVRIDPSMLRWIQRSPQEAGSTVGMQMAKDSMADMVNTAIAAYVAAVSAHSEVYYDDDDDNTLTLAILNKIRALFGDRASDVVCWVMHSKSLFDLYGTALANSGYLFEFGNVKVAQDGFGNPFVVTDAPSLVDGENYYVLGPTAGAIVVDQNNDFEQNTQTNNGDENITRTYQAEWSFNLGLKGYAWDKTSGGKSPDDTALATGTNWDKFVTSFKDTAGVLGIVS